MTPHWTRSSYCDSAGPDCVEVALPAGPAAQAVRLRDGVALPAGPAAQAVRLRDSKAPALPALAFAPVAWSAFTGSVSRAFPLPGGRVR
ncbi:hypothetical protein JCM13580A_43120 [Streptomyces drozdowiczii]|uniref:DUF397 domain-containing protein n=1 Tax=Streptomyces drozdowiczii TaxID=202862 RepID=UPI0031EA0B43